MLVIFFVLDKLISDLVFSSISQLKVCRFQLISILRVNTLLTSNSTLLSRYFQPTAMLRYFRHMNTRLQLLFIDTFINLFSFNRQIATLETKQIFLLSLK